MYDANDELLKAMKDKDDGTRVAMVGVAVDFWGAVAKAIPDWTRVKSGEIKAMDLRQENICSHAVVLRALGAVGAELMQEDPTGWKGRLLELTSVDWKKTNPEWENVCIVAGSVVSNRQARHAMKAFLKRKVGLALTDAEIRAITPAVSLAVA
jgi:DNA sulfur modification protein DndB